MWMGRQEHDWNKGTSANTQNTTRCGNMSMASQGMLRQVKGTTTIFFIKKSKVPQNRYKDVQYGHLSVTIERGKLTIWGDEINYLKDCDMQTADILTAILLLKSVITPIAKILIKDFNNLNLNTPLKRYEYLQLNSRYNRRFQTRI